MGSGSRGGFGGLRDRSSSGTMGGFGGFGDRNSTGSMGGFGGFGDRSNSGSLGGFDSLNGGMSEVLGEVARNSQMNDDDDEEEEDWDDEDFSSGPRGLQARFNLYCSGKTEFGSSMHSLVTSKIFCSLVVFVILCKHSVTLCKCVV